LEGKTNSKENSKNPLSKIFYQYMTLNTFFGKDKDGKPFPGNDKYPDVYFEGKLFFQDWKKFNDPMEGILTEALQNQGYAPIVDNIESALRECKVLCLTESPENPAMWSHYAEKFDKQGRRQPGVCIGFCLTPAFEKQLIKIKYDDELPIDKCVRLGTRLINMENNINYKNQRAKTTSEKIQWELTTTILSYKFKSWNYEKEQRLIIKSSTANLVKIGEITEIILGYSGQNKALNALRRNKRWSDIKPKIGEMILLTEDGKATLKAIREDPRGAVPYFNKGSADYNNHDYDSAIANYIKGTRRKPDFTVAYIGLGNAFARKGDFAHAITNYNKALNFDPDDPEIYYNRGTAYAHKGDFLRAIKDYDNALNFNPDASEVYCNRGSAYKDKGNYDHAIKDYNKALHLKPDFTEAYYNRGIAYDDKGDFERAIKDYNKALRLKPDFAAAYNSRGSAYGNKGDFDHAIKDYNKALRLKTDDDAKVYYNRGNAYGNKGDFDRAIKDYNEALRLKSNYAAVYINRGSAYGNKGNYDKAIADYNKALELKPDYATVYYNRGNAYGYIGDFDKAIDDYNKALKLKHDYADAYCNLGGIYYDKGDFDRAIEYYDNALLFNHDLAIAYYNRGIAHAHNGNFVRAIRDFNKILKINPNDVDAIEARDNTLAAQKIAKKSTPRHKKRDSKLFCGPEEAKASAG
jgi:tetratricopeptide (TPR) repeat protein